MSQVLIDDRPFRARGPAMMLALDEALLMGAEAGEIGPSLRVWEFERPTVVLGRSSKVDLETDRGYCRQQAIEIHRRCSGGATILGGPGCLMYSLVLSISQNPLIARIDGAHRFVMGRVLAAAQRQLPECELQGICDLTWRNRKFSGNALRITRGHVLYHGTVLYAADLDPIGQALTFAPRQPQYRSGRDHASFVTNAPLDRERLSEDLARQFESQPDSFPDLIAQRAENLLSSRYSCDDWRFRH